MSKDKLKTASVLAFERKLDVSDGLFFAGKWSAVGEEQGWEPISLQSKAVRGTISNRLKTKNVDPMKFDADIQKPNLQKVDIAALPHNADTLKVQFTLKVLGGVGAPSACNNLDYQRKLQEVVGEYKKTHGFSILAERYAYNLINGRFLWRNRIGAEQIKIVIRQLKQGKIEQEWDFQALDFSLRDFNLPVSAKTLVEVIEAGFSAETYVLLDVVAYVRLGNGQEVFPSQELVLDKGKSEKSKILYQVNNIAGLHSQKIGNALRTIDTWYSKKENDDVGPISIEPYGSVTSLGKAFRKPNNLDFYSLLDNWLIHDKKPEVEQQHYVMANLIRGGVFGESEKKE